MIPDPRSGRLLRAYALAVWAACALVSCERTPEPPAGAATGAGPRRIVSVGGAVSETLYAIGAGDRVVGVDTSSIYPVEATKLPQVGYQRTLSPEGVLSLSPDLVIITDDAGPPSALELLRRGGVRIEKVASTHTIDGAAARIAAIGALVGGEAAARATALADDVRRTAHGARERAREGGPTFVMIFARGTGNLMIGGAGTAAVSMIELAGGRSAVSDISGLKPLSAEVLIAAAPEVLVVPERGLATLGGESGLLGLPGVAETPAGRTRRIVAFDDLLLLGFGPRLATAIDDLARRLRAPARAAEAAPPSTVSGDEVATASPIGEVTGPSPAVVVATASRLREATGSSIAVAGASSRRGAAIGSSRGVVVATASLPVP